MVVVGATVVPEEERRDPRHGCRKGRDKRVEYGFLLWYLVRLSSVSVYSFSVIPTKPIIPTKNHRKPLIYVD